MEIIRHILLTSRGALQREQRGKRWKRECTMLLIYMSKVFSRMGFPSQSPGHLHPILPCSSSGVPFLPISRSDLRGNARKPGDLLLPHGVLFPTSAGSGAIRTIFPRSRHSSKRYFIISLQSIRLFQVFRDEISFNWKVFSVPLHDERNTYGNSQTSGYYCRRIQTTCKITRRFEPPR